MRIIAIAVIVQQADILRRCGKPDGIGKTACSISHGRDDDSEHRAGFREATLSICYCANRIRDNGAST